MNGYLVMDVENNNSNKYNCDAGCFLIDPIVAIGFKNEKEVKSIYIYPNKLTSLKFDEDIIVGHNLAHDLSFLWYLDDLQEFFKRGGKIWDTQKAEYLLTGHQSTYASLRDIAVNKYGCPDRIKHIDELLFNFQPRKLHELGRTHEQQLERTKKLYPHLLDDITQYKQVSDVPKGLTLDDVENDVMDTEQVYLQQVKEAERLGMIPVIEMQMDSVLAMIECKVNGARIDKEKLLENKAKIEKELEIEYQKLKVLSEKYWR